MNNWEWESLLTREDVDQESLERNAKVYVESRPRWEVRAMLDHLEAMWWGESPAQYARAIAAIKKAQQIEAGQA